MGDKVRYGVGCMYVDPADIENDPRVKEQSVRLSELWYEKFTNLIIAGPRDMAIDSCLLDKYVRSLGVFVREIISGGCPTGIDRIAEQYAQERGISCTVICADWDKYGRAAGPIRNRQMAERADQLLAIWDGKSRGTGNMIQTMQELGKPVTIVWRCL